MTKQARKIIKAYAQRRRYLPIKEIATAFLLEIPEVKPCNDEEKSPFRD